MTIMMLVLNAEQCNYYRQPALIFPTS